MAIYQFMIATQFNSSRGLHMLTDDMGSTTAHLLGLFHRTIQLLEHDIKPIWVFDGKPPAMKATEIERRRRVKVEAKEILVCGAPSTIPHRDPPVQYPSGCANSDNEGKESSTEPRAPRPPAIITKQCAQKRKYIGQIRDLEMEFAAKHSELMGKTVDPLLTCPDFCYQGESDEEEVGEARELCSYYEGLKRTGQTAEELEDARKQCQKIVRVTREMTEDARMLLTLMGVPVIMAPSEAEAQCAALVREGKADAVVSEDMDALVFGSNLLLRGLNSKKEPITEICLEKVLDEFGLSHSEFVDLSILLGCDYCNSIGGVGPVTGYKLIKQLSTLEKVVDYIKTNSKKWTIPEDFYYAPARELFLQPEIIPIETFNLAWSLPDEDQLRKFLTVTKGFAPIKVEIGLKRVKRLQGRPSQTKLDLFFAEAPTKRGPLGPIYPPAPSKKPKITAKPMKFAF